MMSLTPRLALVASLVVPGKPFADIGTDHALLPCYLVETGRCPWGIAGEWADGPYCRALANVKKKKLEKIIRVRQGFGLEVVAPYEVYTLVMAGMGGETMIKILEMDKEKVKSFGRLVLQPNSKLYQVRSWLYRQHLRIRDEDVVWDGRWYVALAAENQGPEQAWSELELEFGAGLLRRFCEPKVLAYLQWEMQRMEKMLEGMTKGRSRIGLDEDKKRMKRKLEELRRLVHGGCFE